MTPGHGAHGHVQVDRDRTARHAAGRGVGWFLSDIRADLRDMRKEVTAIRVEAAASNTRLESLIEEGRRRLSR